MPPKTKLLWVREDGFTFALAYDKEEPDLLHIFVRHLTTVDNALDCFFDSWQASSRNQAYNRFECSNATHGLFWNWMDEDAKKVLIITCFRLEGGRHDR